MTAFGQLRALVGLRWQMVRSRRVRFGLVGLLIALALLIIGAALASRFLADHLITNALVVTPTAFAGFALLALLAPLAAGGGNELFPADQLVGYPIRPGAIFLASVGVTPLNLAWLSQLLVLTALTGAVTKNPVLVPLALVTTYAYVALVTVIGQSLAWAVIGIRQSRRGRLAVWLGAAAATLVTVLVVRMGYTTRVLDRLPTTAVLITVLQGGAGAYRNWARGFAELLVATAGLSWVGMRICRWALRRPGTGRRSGDRPVRRRGPSPTAFRALLSTDRASVWRTPSLRRGALVLMLLPAIAAASLGVSWESLVLVPGLVAAGTGLLFGVNAFCLDASGAIWLASLPHRPILASVAKAWVIVETCLLAILAVVLAGAVRAKVPPTAAEMVALAVATVCCTAWVTATCMKLSVTHPHRADLRGTRDTPAPPGSMAMYSARLAVSTTVIGLLVSTGAYAGSTVLSGLVGLPVLLFAARSLLRTLRSYESPAIRARVVQTVAAG
ncbi:MAG: hypothetical protein M3O55_08010 [Actinomycetota bacterium]|nr:hypothetical protein [Actinomycetota bacterium]